MHALSVLVVAFVSGLIFVPLARWLSIKLGRISVPGPDRWSQRPTPRLGGIGIFLAFSAGLAVSEITIASIMPLVIAGGFIFLLGLYDDFRDLSPPSKLIGQIIAAAIVIFVGYRIEFFPFDVLNILLTFVWLVGMTNAINLIDNMDGLAAGISLIVALFLAYFFFRAPEQAGFLQLDLALAGSLAAFLIFNFPPAKVFMGDSGSMFLGFSLATLAVIRRASASNVLAVLGIPALLFLLPILDTALVTITRLLRGQSPTHGGRDHTSHRLIAFGLTERQTLLVLYSVVIVSGIASAAVENVAYDFSLVFVPVLILALSVLTAYLGKLQVVKSRQDTQPGYAIAKIVMNMAYRQRLFEIVLDFFIICIAFYLAIWAQFDLHMTNQQLDFYVQALPIALVGSYLAFFLFGVYRGVWDYFGIGDLAGYFKAVVGAVCLVGIGVQVIFTGILQIFTILLFGVFLLFGLSVTRSSFRVLDRIYSSRPRTSDERVVLYGAGVEGELLLRWMLANPDVGYRPVGFIDEDRTKWGRLIHGVQILGGVDRLLSMQNQFDGLIITAPNLPDSNELEEVVDALRNQGRWVRKFRFDLEPID
jgi:UDP-GlcNAc:undecaprenyl-phosphate/decaprenyl-phosphate GlcNAc-1-phosphate transferase